MGKYQAECDYQLALLNSNKRIDELEQGNASLQAKIDALMLEYCPDEMSQEQVHGWCVAQRPVEV